MASLWLRHFLIQILRLNWYGMCKDESICIKHRCVRKCSKDCGGGYAIFWCWIIWMAVYHLIKIEERKVELNRTLELKNPTKDAVNPFWCNCFDWKPALGNRWSVVQVTLAASSLFNMRYSRMEILFLFATMIENLIQFEMGFRGHLLILLLT